MFNKNSDYISYIWRDDHWKETDEIKVRVKKLEKTDFVKIEVEAYNQWLGTYWVELGIFETKKGHILNNHPVSVSTILNKLKQL